SDEIHESDPRTDRQQGPRYHGAPPRRGGAAWIGAIIPDLRRFPAPDGARKRPRRAAAAARIVVRFLALEARTHCLQRTSDGAHRRRRLVVLRPLDGGG